MSDQAPHQTPPRRKAQKEVDHKYPFPQSYYCFNPQLFDDEHWKFRDLQKLCKTLGVPVNDCDERTLSPNTKNRLRESFISELQRWHKTPIRQSNARHVRRKGTTNFALLQVQVPDENAPQPAANEDAKQDPKLLTPLKNKPRRHKDGTPISVLRPHNLMTRQTGRSPARHLAIREGSLFSPSDPRHQKRNIKMSIFNGAKIIPPKQTIFDDWLSEAGITYESESEESDAFMSPTKDHINKFYQQHAQHQQQQQPTTPTLDQQPQQQQLQKSIGFAAPPSPTSSINSDAGSTPMKSAKNRQQTPAIKKSDQVVDDDDDDDEFSLPEELDDAASYSSSHQLESMPEEQPEYDNAMSITPVKQQPSQQQMQQQQQQQHALQGIAGPMTRRRSFAAQQQQQQQETVPQLQMQQQNLNEQRPKPLSRASITRTQQNKMVQQPASSQIIPPVTPVLTKTNQSTHQKNVDPIDQELIEGMNSLSF